MNIFPFLSAPWWDVNKDNVLHVVDAIIFLLFLISVMYLLFFALMSLTKWKMRYDTAKRKHRFIIIYLTHAGDDENIINSVEDLQNQDYPMDKYDILVGYTGLRDTTIDQLQTLGIETYQLDNSYDSGSSIKKIMAALPEKAYDMTVLFDANNIVTNDFLTRMNEAYYSGCMAVQSHRVPVEIRSMMGRLSSISEEINNSIFRKGHIQVGFSAALNSSGIVIDYDWMKENADSLKKNDVVKQLETSLLKQNIYIDYMNDVYTFITKGSSQKRYRAQHSRWQKETFVSIFRELPRLPLFIFQGNWDYCNKILQWTIPSRINLTLLIALFAFVTFIYDWSISIKWFILLIVLFIAYAVAAPDKVISKDNYKK